MAPALPSSLYLVLQAAHGFSGQAHHQCPGGDAVTDRVGSGGIIDKAVEALGRELGGDHRGGGLAPLVQDLEQLPGGGHRNGREPEVIDLSRCRDKSIYPDDGVIPMGKTDTSSHLPPELVSALAYRDNYRLSRKASSLSDGLNRPGGDDGGVIRASARSLTLISACR